MADGDDMILGQTNNAAKTTKLRRSGAASSPFQIAGPALYVEDTDGGGIVAWAPSDDGITGGSEVGSGVYGFSTQSSGVTGGSTESPGVFGGSKDSTGVYGYSKNEPGVSGFSVSDSGIYGVSAREGETPIDGGGPGIGGGSGVHGENDGAAGVGVKGTAFGLAGTGLYGEAAIGYGVFAESRDVAIAGWNPDTFTSVRFAAYDGAGVFNGNVNVNGNLMKSGGGFLIDHPVTPGIKYLAHSFVESPDMKNIYDGVTKLNANGEATIKLPDWFESLNKEFRYQLTAIGRAGPGLYVSQGVKRNQFKIAGGRAHSRVSWQVTGIRRDAWATAHRIPVETNKPTSERGLYRHPEVYGKSASKGVEWQRNRVRAAPKKAANKKHSRNKLKLKAMAAEFAVPARRRKSK